MSEKPEKHPDRPLECTECKRPIKVHYTEMIADKVTHTGMCEICPQLQKRLKGVSPEEAKGIIPGVETGIACGECGTNLQTVRTGNQMGCSHCYEVFGDVLFMELATQNKIPQKTKEKGKSVPLHIGRSPGETQEISPSLKLIALNEALDETLKREDYEQAAWLRDQINALTEEKEEKNDKKG